MNDGNKAQTAGQVANQKTDNADREPEIKAKANRMWDALCARMDKAGTNKRDVGHGLIVERLQKRWRVTVGEPAQGELRSAPVMSALKELALPDAVLALHDLHRVLDSAGISVNPRRADGQGKTRRQPGANNYVHHGHGHNSATAPGNGSRHSKATRYRPHDEAMLGHDQDRPDTLKIDEVLDDMRRPIVRLVK